MEVPIVKSNAIMRKTLLIAIGYSLLATSLFGQGTNDVFMKQLTRETCDELLKIDFSKKTPDEFKMSLGLTLVKVMGQHQPELKSLGVNTFDERSLEKVATEVGMRLAAECPVFVEALTKNQDAIKEFSRSGSASGNISGKVLKVVGGDFTYLQVEDDKGKIEKLWWMEYFDGANKFLADPQKQVNRAVRVRYVEKEMFNSTLNDYVKVKVITSIE
jgi:hypothetical protein